jgi:LPS sulfotransferase NodH
MYNVKSKRPSCSSCRRLLWRARRLSSETLKDIWFGLRRKAPTARLVIVVGTSHRVGSTWLYQMLRDMTHCRLGRRKAPAEFLRFGTLILEQKVYEYLRQLKGHYIFKSHSLPPKSETQAKSATFVSIYRDPRDVLVSASFYLAHLEEEKGGWGQAFQALPISERIRVLIERSDLLTELEQWFAVPFVHQTRYEDLVRQPVDELSRIAEWIGVPTTTKALEGIASRHSFESRSGRKQGDSCEQATLRKGIVGDWRNYFEPTLVTTFKTQRDGRWNRLLVSMGYECSLDWS